MKKLSLLFILCLEVFVLFAQQRLPCGTDERQREMMMHLPPAAPQRGATQGDAAAKTTAGADTAFYDVPFVIHVVHDYGAEYLPDDTIFNWFEAWAKVFVKQNADTADVIAPFKPYIGNLRMRLRLASKDPSGNPTKGITRRQSYLTSNGGDQAKFDQWPPDRYVNIWFVEDIDGATAYAYFPYMAVSYPWYDGPICMASVGNYMKTIPHELGHYFSVHHTWGDIGCGVDCSGIDSVDDTPPTKGHPVTGCVASALYDTICATGYAVHYTDMLGGDSVYDYPDTGNAQNIMDYTYCPRMFTSGQAHRMRTSLNSPYAGRSNLRSAVNLALTGALAGRPDLPPVADFTLNKAVGAGMITDKRTCFLSVGSSGSFQFRNTSWNDTLSGLSWTFSNGASTPTSAAPAVTNRFSVPGWVTVSLTATSNAGSNTVVRAKAVYAADTTPVGGIGYSQSFGSAAAIASWPMINYYSNSFKWEPFTGAGKDDNNCVRFYSYDVSSTATPPRTTGTATGDIDDMFTPAFNLSGVSGDLYVNFYTTGASTLASISPWDALTLDTLEIYASVSGGAQWQLLGIMDGYELQNNGTFATSFTPGTSAPWVSKSIAVPEGCRAYNTFFRFRYRPGNTGNNVYLDNFSLSGVPAGVQESLDKSPYSFGLLPNPAKAMFNIVLRAGSGAEVPYRVTDISGRVLTAGFIKTAAGAMATEAVALPGGAAAGIYFVTVTVDGVSITQKLVITE